MVKKKILIFNGIIILIVIVLGLLLFKTPSNPVSGAFSKSFFEDSSNYLDDSGAEERFEHYTSTSRHTAKKDINLQNPLFYNGYEVIIAGKYIEKEMYGENLGILTDAANQEVILVNKSNQFEQGIIYEVTGIVRVVNYSNNYIPVVCVNKAEIYPKLSELKELFKDIYKK